MFVTKALQTILCESDPRLRTVGMYFCSFYEGPPTNKNFICTLLVGGAGPNIYYISNLLENIYFVWDCPQRPVLGVLVRHVTHTAGQNNQTYCK